MRLFIIILIYTAFACNNFSKKNQMEHMEIIHYGTEAFNSFENLSPIKKEEARKLCIDFCNKNDIKGGNSPLFFIIDSFYVFSPYNNPKIPEVSLTGIWVNAKTGEVKYIKNHQKIRPESQFGWRSRTGLQ